MTCQVRHTLALISTDTSDPEQTVEVWSIEFDFSDWDPYWCSVLDTSPMTQIWLDQIFLHQIQAVNAVSPIIPAIPPANWISGYLEEQVYDGLYMFTPLIPAAHFTRRIYNVLINRYTNSLTPMLFPLSPATKTFLDDFSSIVGCNALVLAGGIIYLAGDPLWAPHWRPIVGLWSLPTDVSVGGGPVDANGWRPQRLPNGPTYPGPHDVDVFYQAWLLPDFCLRLLPFDSTMSPQYWLRQKRVGGAQVAGVGLTPYPGGPILDPTYSYQGDQVVYRTVYTESAGTASNLGGGFWLYQLADTTYSYDPAAAVDAFWSPAFGDAFFDFSDPPPIRPPAHQIFHRCTIRPWISTQPAQDIQPGGALLPGVLYVP